MLKFLKRSALTGLFVASLLSGCLGGSSEPAAVSVSSGTTSAVANPAVEGPVEGGIGTFVSSTLFPLFLVGYQQSEYFLSGSATSYALADGQTALSSDGKWSVKPASHADYKTRIVVYRPIFASNFNGTVLVEWLNTSGGLDAAPDWIMAHTELIRQGYAWVGVSVQAAGIQGGGSFSVIDLPLKTFDPTRYGTLHHPGDSYSYDIFSQAAQAVRHPQNIDPLGGLTIKAMIATGESQSAYRMTTYVNAIAPLARLFDGFMIHSRPFGSAALSELPQAVINAPNTVFVRDVGVPVMTLETESDLLSLQYYSNRQADSDKFRLWEVAGTAHADTYTLSGLFDVGIDPTLAQVSSVTNIVPGLINCDLPVNSGPQHHFVADAAFTALNRWVTTGVPPAFAPRLSIAGSPPAFVLDASGNVQGGIRTPYVDVPVAKLSGLGQPGSMETITHGGNSFCFLFGTTTLFDSATLSALYPSHASYVAAVNASTDSAVAQGFLLATDAELIKKAAEDSTIGN